MSERKRGHCPECNGTGVLDEIHDYCTERLSCWVCCGTGDGPPAKEKASDERAAPPAASATNPADVSSRLVDALPESKEE